MRIVVAAGICVHHDAISAAMIEQARVLRGLEGVDDVAIIAQHCNREVVDRPVQCVGDAWAFIRHPAVEAADLVIFHWGIAYELFDALSVVAQQRRAVVHFHNVTPLEFAAKGARAGIEWSLRQIQLAATTDSTMWTESEYNVRTLVSWGFEAERVRFMPFPIGSHRTLRRPPRGPEVRLLTVGRLVQAKGLAVLVEALGRALDRLDGPVALVIAGNRSLSDADFLTTLRDSITRPGLDSMVDLVEDPDDDRLWDLYEWADIVVSPSFHEGLCVPVIEGYLAGCRVIGSDAGNLPFVVQPPDPVVPAGDPIALADAIVELTARIRAGDSMPPPGAAALTELYSVASTEAHLREALAELR